MKVERDKTEKLLEMLLQQKHETQFLEFKREIKLDSDKDHWEFAKDVSAFANTKGGSIVFGKEDPRQGGQIVGIKPETFDADQMQQVVSSKCYPPVDFEAKIVSYQSKHFALLKIPESSKKPHEFPFPSREVWMRRQGTTDRATAQEISIMTAETRQRIEQTEPMESEQRNFESAAIATSVILFSIIFYFSIRQAGFWIWGKDLQLKNWLIPEAILPPIIIIPLVVYVLNYVYGQSCIRKIVSVSRRISTCWLVVQILFLVSLGVLNTLMFLYPESVTPFLQPSWQSFFVLCFLCVGIASIAIFFSNFPIARYLFISEDKEYSPNPKKETMQLGGMLRRHMKFLRKRFSAVILLSYFLLVALVVPFDLSYRIFIPQYNETGSFSLSDNQAYGFIYAERIGQNTVQAEIRLYRLAQISYTVLPARFPIVNAIQLKNPFSVSQASFSQPHIGSIDSSYSDYNVGYVCNSTPPNVECSFLPERWNFTHIQFIFPTVSQTFVANISYWKLLENENLSLTCMTPQYSQIDNETWLERYTFIIANNLGVSLRVMALEFDRFMFAVVNTTTTRVYSQGQEMDWAYFAIQNRRLGELWSIGSGYNLNITLTFHSSDIS